MEKLQMKLKCKDFDSWVSFLGRLSKIGHDYIIKNDIYIATERNIKSGTTDKYPGRHIVKDPLFMDECYVEDGVYMVSDIETIISEIQRAQENDMDCRKNIEYFRTEELIGIQLGNYAIDVARLITGETTDNIKNVANSVTWFDDLFPIAGEESNTESNDSLHAGWDTFTDKDLINIRNNGIFNIHKETRGRTVATRLARSLFCLAGVSRMDTPIALAGEYTTFPSDQSDVAILRIHAIYKCGQSLNITVNTIHEYLVLIYNEI